MSAARARDIVENRLTAQPVREVRRRAGRTAAGYFLVCSAFLVASGVATDAVDINPSGHLALEVGKGLTFAAVSAGILYALLRRIVRESERSAAWLRRTIDSIYDAVLIVDWSSRRIIDCNPAAALLFRYAPSELIGGTTEMLHVSPDHFRKFAQVADAALKQDGVYLGDFEMRARDGRIFATQHSMGTFVDDDGRLTAVSVIRDSTQRRRIDAELRVSQRLKAVGQIAAGVAHDFNNHLTVILSNLGQVRDGSTLGPTDRSRVRASLRAARRASQLAADLTMSARRRTPAPARVNLGDAVAQVMNLLERTFTPHIELAIEVSAEDIHVFLEPAALGDAILNLAVNARDAMPQSGTLTLSVSRRELDEPLSGIDGHVPPGAYGLLTVSDTGAGIPPEHLPKVVEPFFTTKETGEGSGLGLSMVHEFVRESKGHMRISSAVGQGTTVELFFPLTP